LTLPVLMLLCSSVGRPLKVTVNTYANVYNLYTDTFKIFGHDGHHKVMIKSDRHTMKKIAKWIQNNSFKKYSRHVWDKETQTFVTKREKGSEFVPVNFVLKLNNWELVVNDPMTEETSNFQIWTKDMKGKWWMSDIL